LLSGHPDSNEYSQERQFQFVGQLLIQTGLRKKLCPQAPELLHPPAVSQIQAGAGRFTLGDPRSIPDEVHQTVEQLHSKGCAL